MGMQDLIHLVYPPQCLACGGLVVSDFGLCPTCWRDTPFIAGLVCQKCGTPLPGEAAAGEDVLCDDCLTLARPWTAGRAAMLYGQRARDMVLALKHGDRMDVARPAAHWMLRAGAGLIRPGMIVAPVPLHWQRLFTRRYNQSALLSGQIARMAQLDHCPDLLQRIRQTHTQDGKSREGRFDNVAGAFRLHPRRAPRIIGRPVLLIDDVMTSGATLAAAADICLEGGASEVSVLVMARVVKEH
jgi:ComF family protein